VKVVYLNLFNDGRGAALFPEVHLMVFPKKLISFVHYTLDMMVLSKFTQRVASETYANTLDEENIPGSEDALALEFLDRAKTIEHLYGHKEGKRFLLGYAFEGGSQFYFASERSAMPPKTKFAAQTQYVTFQGVARNADKNKIIGFNIPLDISAWEKVRFDYKMLPMQAGAD
jgi:hypothetical protein